MACLYKRLTFLVATSALGLVAPHAIVSAQEFGVEEGVSEKEMFRMGNYRGALREYLALLEEEKDNAEYKYIIGQCYLNMNDDKSLAIPYLQSAWKADQSHPEVLFDLAKAHHLTMDFDKAIELFNEFKTLEKDPVVLEDAERQIDMCRNGKELIKFPLNITFENLGKKINSAYPDYSPFVPNDESYLIFTSRRKGNKGNLLDYDGYYTSDVYMSRVKRGEFGKASNVSSVNTESDEEAAGISPEGGSVLIFVDDVFQNIYANIYLAQKKGRSIKSLQSVSGFVNTPTTLETSASITTGGQLLYFASNIKGGFGGMDLYVCRKMPDGSWGESLNLGPNINTKYDEEYPTITYDGATLYFSSTGHTSMGGYDIFVSKRDFEKDKWGPPSNLGYPLNNAEDNMSISFSAKWDMDTETERNKFAYISAWRKGGFGDLDIYRVTFIDVEEQLTALRGQIRERVLIDYSVYNTFHYYKKDGQTIMVPDVLYPWYDDSWALESSKKLLVKQGYEYRTMLYFTKAGVQKAFSSKKFPKDNPEWTFVKIRNVEIKQKGYVAPKVLYEELPLPETVIYVTDMNYGNEYTYVPTRKGKYIMILPSGSYEIMIESEGYPAKVIPLNIYDKGSYQSEIVKDYVFESEN